MTDNIFCARIYIYIYITSNFPKHYFFVLFFFQSWMQPSLFHRPELLFWKRPLCLAWSSWSPRRYKIGIWRDKLQWVLLDKRQTLRRRLFLLQKWWFSSVVMFKSVNSLQMFKHRRLAYEQKNTLMSRSPDLRPKQCLHMMLLRSCSCNTTEVCFPFFRHHVGNSKFGTIFNLPSSPATRPRGVRWPASRSCGRWDPRRTGKVTVTGWGSMKLWKDNRWYDEI